jgi:hypothetical protein
MDRKIYEPSKNQLRKWGEPGKDIEALMPSADDIKAMWKKSHHGKLNGWGMKKRDIKLSLMTATYEYQVAIWQGRVDALNGLEYSEDRNESAYNLGYHRGYTNFTSDWKGFDNGTRQRFTEKYGGN